MLHTVAARLPKSILRMLNRLQFTRLGGFLTYLNRKVLAREGSIQTGIGKGLQFNAAGTQAGYILGTADYAEQEWLRSILKPGDTFYDIGANCGFFAVLAGRLVSPGGRVYAFEPHPQNATRVRENVEMNGFAHVEIIEAAVSNSDGTGILKIGTSETQHFLSTTRAEKSVYEGELEVAVVSVDTLVQGGTIVPPDVVMIDAEGAEIEVLKGMMSTISAHRPHMVCEVHWLGDTFVRFVRESLEPLGYSAMTLAGGDLPSGCDRYHAVLSPSKPKDIQSSDIS